MSRVKIYYPAPPNTIFSEDAVQGTIGDEFTAKMEETIVGVGKVIDAVVVNNGKGLELTLEWPEE